MYVNLYTYVIDYISEPFVLDPNFKLQSALIYPVIARVNLGKSVPIVLVGFPARSQMRLFLEYSFLKKIVVMSRKKNMAEAFTRGMASLG